MSTTSRCALVERPLPTALLLFFLFYPACSGQNEERPEEILRDYPSEFVHHLVDSDDSTFAEYGREVGIDLLICVHRELYLKVMEFWIAEEDDKAARLFRHAFRIASVLESEYHYEHAVIDMRYVQNLPDSLRRRVLERRQEYRTFYRNREPTYAEQLERYLELLRGFENDNDLSWAAVCKERISACYDAMGNNELRMKYLRAACSGFEKSSNHRMRCQLLGELGGVYAKNGDIDSMIVCYEEAKRIANLCRLPTQAPRICTFYAWHYAARGRLTLASDLLNEAMELCREYKGGILQIRFIYENMRFHAELGCWDVVERLLERARILKDEIPPASWRKDYYAGFQIATDRIEARLKIVRGEWEEAEIILKRIDESIHGSKLSYSQRTEDLLLFYYWAEGLLKYGRLNEALEKIDAGMNRSREANIPFYSARFSLLAAKAEYELGRVEDSKKALRNFDSFAGGMDPRLQKDVIERDVLYARLAAQGGDSTGAVRLLKRGLERMQRYVMDRDASVQSYMWTSECDALRECVHDLVSKDPGLGYGAELYWRDLFTTMGKRVHEEGTPESALAAAGFPTAVDSTGDMWGFLRRWAESARSRIARHGGVHCVYLPRGESIWRWTVSNGKIRREVLDVSADEAEEIVSRARRLLTGEYEGAAAPSAELRGLLRTLALVVLPDEILQGEEGPEHRTFFVTTDGSLGRIPFETFDVGSGESYTPLLTRWDVAYLRHADSTPAARENSPGVILANAEPSGDLRKRYPFQRVLREVENEAAAVAAVSPGATLLVGPNATKPNLISAWERASFVYLAAHTIRDPQVPYLMLVPLATSGDYAGPDETCLDVTDIRSADLGGCDLVVLSGCSSGLSYAGSCGASPSLGEAFLDAGVGAVVQTFWDVRDDDARQIMTAYAQCWGTTVNDRIRGLCDCRRQYIEIGETGRPFLWAAYSIKIGRF